MWKGVIPDTFLLGVYLQVVLFSIILLFMVVKSSLAKMLANSDDLASRPWEARTPDTLIKSQVLYQLS